MTAIGFKNDPWGSYRPVSVGLPMLKVSLEFFFYLIAFVATISLFRKVATLHAWYRFALKI